MPRLAAFPKAFMQALCKDGTMRVAEWIDLAVELDIDDLEPAKPTHYPIVLPSVRAA